jgi:hypothetical protein
MAVVVVAVVVVKLRGRVGDGGGQGLAPVGLDAAFSTVTAGAVGVIVVVVCMEMFRYSWVRHGDVALRPVWTTVAKGVWREVTGGSGSSVFEPVLFGRRPSCGRLCSPTRVAAADRVLRILTFKTVMCDSRQDGSKRHLRLRLGLGFSYYGTVYRGGTARLESSAAVSEGAGSTLSQAHLPVDRSSRVDHATMRPCGSESKET